MPNAYPSFPAAEHTKPAKTLRICLVTPEIAGPARNNGVGTACAALAETLAGAGHAVTVLCMRGTKSDNHTFEYWVDQYRAKGVALVALREYLELNIESPFYIYRPYEAYLWLRENPFDVIHYAECYGIGYFVALAKHQGLAFSDTLLVVTTHGPTAWTKQLNGITPKSASDFGHDYMERQSVALADIAISPSAYMFDWLKNQGWVLPSRAYVQQNIMLTSESVAPNDAGHVHEIVFFGRLEPRKGYNLFCDALEMFAAEELANVTVTFLGKPHIRPEGDGTEEITRRAANWKFKWQMFGDKGHGEALDYLRTHACLAVIPSLGDNSPYTVLECLGAGVPVLASAVGGIPELIAEEDRAFACFVPEATILAGALRKILRDGAKPARPALTSDVNNQAWMDWHRALEVPSTRKSVQFTKESAPFVSVCILNKNVPHMLERTLASVHAQDYPNLKIIAVGEEDNLNAALQRTQGEYIKIMEAGDIAKPNEISVFMQVAQKRDADIVNCFADIYEGDTPPDDHGPCSRRLFLGPSLAVGAYENCFGENNFLIRKDVCMKLGDMNDAGQMKRNILVHAVQKGYRMEMIPEALFWKRAIVDEHMQALFGNDPINKRRARLKRK